MSNIIPAFITEQHKADFMDLLYEKSGRTNGLYTGLWEEFCRERGEYYRALHMVRALQQKANPEEGSDAA